METVRERLDIQASATEMEEAQKHNAMISERYRQLQNAIADQFSEEIEERNVEEAYADVSTPAKSLYISPSNVNTALLEQTPTVTEYVSPTTSALFTTEKFERMQSYQDAVVQPQKNVEIAPMQVTSVNVEAQYSLAPFAKVMMAIVTFVIVAMLTLICVNTQLINQKKVRIQNLEQKKEQLLEAVVALKQAGYQFL